MKKIFNEIDELQKKIGAVRPIDPALQRSLQERLRIEWTYHSNAIEGNTLTFGETAFFLREGLTAEGRPLKDHLEAKNHAEAIDGLQEIISGKRQMTESLIKELHAVLLKGIEFTQALGRGQQEIQKPVSPGQYKTQPNHVLTLSGTIHHYVDPLHVRDEMEKLLLWYGQKSAAHPVERGAVFHYRFVKIHPFDDGNGRMARILMNLVLMKEGYPPCIIQRQHRRKYLGCLETADKQENLLPLIGFIAEELLATQKTILGILQGGDIGLPQKAHRLSPQARDALIFKVLEDNPASIGEIHRLCPQIKRPTLKSDLQHLLRLKKIQKSGKGKGVVYSLLVR
jgi:Fic family protein